MLFYCLITANIHSLFAQQVLSQSKPLLRRSLSFTLPTSSYQSSSFLFNASHRVGTLKWFAFKGNCPRVNSGVLVWDDYILLSSIGFTLLFIRPLSYWNHYVARNLMSFLYFWQFFSPIIFYCVIESRLGHQLSHSSVWCLFIALTYS